MDRAGTSRSKRSVRGRAAGLLAGVTAGAALLLLPGSALAFHGNQTDWDTFNLDNPSSPALVCTSCHSLDPNEGEPLTSYINSSSRTLPLMKAFNGGSVPGAFGCTYCHNTPTNTRMRGVLNHFTAGVTKHPVGKNFATGADTNYEYLSANGSAATTELDCLDCHDVTLINPGGATESAVSHAAPPANNPFMLKSVTVDGEYDALCRTCHGSGVAASANYKGNAGVDIRLGVAADRHGDASGGAQNIVEDDGTQLRTTVAGGGAQCTACHDTHYSGKALLFNDGHEGDTAIVSSDCTSVCHFPGDDDNYVSPSDNNYVNHGHGMATSTYKYNAGVVDDINYTGSYVTMGITCTGCHNQIDTSDVSASRRAHVTRPTGGTDQENYKGRFNLDNLPLQAGDTGSMFGNPLWGVCFTCHPAYEQHRSSVAGDDIGCQDCHDEHAEGSGAGSNLFMIPETSKPQGTYKTTYVNGPILAKAGAEVVRYEVPRLNPADGTKNIGTADFYNDTPADSGVCDNAECHGAGGYAPLSGWMPSHSGGNLGTGVDCEGCHAHNGDPGGGWRATASCSNCHGTSGVNAYPDGTAYPDTAGQHLTHVTAIAAVNGLSTTNTSTCDWCHPNPGIARTGTGELSHDSGAAPADLHGDGRAGAAVTHFKAIAGAADTGDSVTIGTSCNNVNCHYNATVTIADWYGTPAVDCDFCHYGGVGTYTPGGLPRAHDKHVDEIADGGYGLACTVCHTDYGTTWGHQDGDVAGDVVFSGVPWGNDADEVVTGGNGAVKYGGGLAVDYYGCAGISCHGDYTGGNTANAPNWFNTGGSGDGQCGSCHGSIGAPAPAYADGSPKANKHDVHVNASSFGCQVCHNPVTTDGTTIADRTLHADGAYSVDDDNAAPTLDSFAYAAGSCSAVNCHGGNAVAWNAAGPFTCDTCHGEVGGAVTNVDVNNFAWDGTTQSKVSASEFSARGHGAKGAACAGCHDSAVDHDPTMAGTNPFRLAAGFTCTSGAAACHDGTPTASVATVVNHTRAEMVTAGYSPQVNTWTFSPDCVSCHDPHGDDANLRMAQRELYESSFALNAAPPAVPTEQTNLVFTDGSTGASAANNAAAYMSANYDGLCQACHESADPDFTSFKDGATPISTSPHPSAGANPGDCFTCHGHDQAFMPAGGCATTAAGCHGTDGANSYPDGSPGVYPDRAGAHQKHVDAGAGCDSCHPGVPPVGHSSDTTTGANQGEVIRMDTDGNGFSGPPTANDYWESLEGPTVNNGTLVYFKNLVGANDTNAYYDTTTDMCNNLDCHGGGTTPGWYSGGADTTPPSWSPEGITVTDLVQTGFKLGVSWNAASDATAVTYELRRSTSSFGGTCSGGTVVGGGAIAGTYYEDTVANATTYYYCVNATDSAPAPGPYTTTGTVEDSGAASEPAAGGSCWVGSGYSFYPGAYTSAGTSTATTTYIDSNIAANIDCTLDTFCYYNGTGNPSGLQVFTGTVSGTNVTNTGDEITINPPTTSNSWNCTTQGTYTLPILAGQYIGHYGGGIERANGGGAYVYSSGADNTPPATNWTGTSSTTAGYSFFATGSGGPPPDSTPPAFGGITGAVDAASGGTVNLSWTGTTDTGTGDSNPVVYRIWWNALSSNGNPAQGTHDATTTATTYAASGLTVGDVHYFLVRAEDAAGNIEGNTTELTATPTAGGGGGGGCTTCHDVAPTTGAHQAHANNDTDYTDCDNCHGNATVSPSGTVSGRTTAYTTSGPIPPHNDGVAGVWINATYDGDSNGANNYNSGTKVCSDVSCHGAGTPTWDNPGSVVCGSCHGTVARNSDDRDGYPPSPSGQYVEGKHANHVILSNSVTGSYCDLCHDGAGSGSASHGTGTVDVLLANGTGPGGAGRGTFTPGAKPPASTCSSLNTGTCHGGTAGWDSTVTLTCTDCHTGITSHIDYNGAAGGGGACEDCHPGGGAGKPNKHTTVGNTGVIEIPNYTVVGINRSSGGIHLGGAQTSGASEAEMCWNCHSAQSVDGEFGTNSNLATISPSTSGITYNYGTLTGGPNWIGATWNSAQTSNPSFAYKSGPIQSVHTANPSGAPWNGPTSNTGDTAGQIRCSYCHDVHDQNLAPGDSATGKPWLRGNWVGSPYKEDGAPQAGQTMQDVNSWGAIPRGSSGSTVSMGGYWIDLNSGNPNVWTADQFGGLCALCHDGTPGDDASWTGDELASINVFGTMSDWVSGLNGHANSVKEATRDTAAARNIFDARGAVSGTTYDGFQHFQGQSVPGSSGSEGFRGASGLSYAPLLPASRPCKYNKAEWGVDELGTTVNSTYHQYTCSKCHVPHASRLPRLMKTNCLDTRHNTYDDDSGSTGVRSTVGTASLNRTTSNYTSAVNCHSVGSTSANVRDTTYRKGWNNVTPW